MPFYVATASPTAQTWKKLLQDPPVDDMPDDIRWIRSYVLNEQSGSLGTVCIYEASSEDAIRQHAAAAELAVSEIIPIADTVVVRPDPT